MIERIALYPLSIARLQRIKGDIYKKVGTFTAEAFVSDEPVPKEKWDELAYVPFEKGKKWTDTKFACCVFRLHGTVGEEGKGKKVVALLKLGAEGEVYRDGRAVCGVTPILSTIDAGQPRMGKQVVPLFACAEGGETVDLTVDCGHNGYCGAFLYDPRLVKADIVTVDEERKGYYYDYLFLLLSLTTVRDNAYLSNAKASAIKRAMNASYALYAKGDVMGARSVLKPFMEGKQTEGVTYTAIGHGHLDLAWRWPIRESKRKAIRTFSNVVTYLDDYDFVFGASQAQMFRWVEESDPDLFKRVQEKIREGKIEPQGGMWTECDCLVPCGESLIRQFLYGGKYFEEKFGMNSDVAWLPDAFGFPNTLPQILKGVGKKYFMTIKLNWNETNEFPYQFFTWVAPDGSKVTAHFAPEGTYHCSATPLSFVKSDKKNKQKDVENALLIYGVSDGGGGPGEGHLEMVQRAGTDFLPKAAVEPSVRCFERAEGKAMPEYTGELYLEKHRGTLTSQANNKYYNRYAERRLHELEWVEALSGDRFAERDEIWRTLLTDQFHDILPGSSIGRVHKESVEELIAVCQKAENATKERLAAMADGKKFCVLNPAPFDYDGRIVYGGEIYRVQCPAYASCNPVPTEETPFIIGKNALENDALKVTFDEKTGKITSVYDKEKGREESAGTFFTLALYDDPKGKYDAWDIDESYLKRAPRTPDLTEFRTGRTKNRAVAYVESTFGKSTVTQAIYLKEGKTIYFETHVKWNETHKMLRADFRPRIYSPTANFDVQFGSIDRSTKNETKIERAQFEVCGHYYAAVGDDEQGYFSVMNRGKYGYRVKDGSVSLNLLRAPTFPDPDCDRGTHDVFFAVRFADDGKDVVKQAYLYNKRLIRTEENVAVLPLIRIPADNVIIETIKLAEDGTGIVVRAYERFGREADAPFLLDGEYDVYETDLIERDPRRVERAIFRPHEIKTYLLRKK